MRDKQAFEAFVLEKSRARKQEIQRRRRTILTTGMSLCVCLLVVVCVTAVWKPWQDNGEALTPSVPPPQATMMPPDANGTFGEEPIPDKVEVLLGGEVRTVDKTLRIYIWVMQLDSEHITNGAGNEDGAETYTIRIYYPEKTVTCYFDSKNALFKMADGPWVAVDAADVAEFKGFFDN